MNIKPKTGRRDYAKKKGYDEGGSVTVGSDSVGGTRMLMGPDGKAIPACMEADENGMCPIPGNAKVGYV